MFHRIVAVGCGVMVFAFTLRAPSAIPAAPKVSSTLSPEHKALAQVQYFYEHAGDFRGHFTQVYRDQMRGKTRQESGQVWVAHDGRVRWTYRKPERKEFIFDGKTAYFYEPENAQVTVFDHFGDSRLSTIMQFLWGRGDIAARFHVHACQQLCHVVNKSAPDGQLPGSKSVSDVVVELVPKEPIPSVTRVALVIGKDGVLRTTATLDPLGNVTEYHFSKLTFHQTIASSNFTFTTPDGVQLLRASAEDAGPK